MFHSENGLFFDRVDTGVRIVKTTDGSTPLPDGSNVVFDQTVSDGTWCSAMCSVSSKGESDGRWFVAKDFHGSR